MPPKRVGRPAARLRVRAKAAAKAAAKAGAKAAARAPLRVRRKPAKADPPKVDREGWIRIEEDTVPHFRIGGGYLVQASYAGEEGKAQVEVLEQTQDSEGDWIGVLLKGTHIPQLRTWWITQQGPQTRLYLSKTPVNPAQRKHLQGVGYLLSYKEVSTEDQYPWMENCTSHNMDGEPMEMEDLRRAAGSLGYPLGRGEPFPPLPAVPQPAGEHPKTPEDDKKKKKKKEKTSSKAKVKAMVERAKWSPQGTPMDPSYRRPIKFKVKKGKSSSSSSGSGKESESSVSGEEGLGSEHRLRAIGRKLPGYLGRSAAKEAKKVLAEASGEDLASYKVFHRYFRQVIAPRGGSKGIQRELLTLSILLDTLQAGDVLPAIDIIAQRMKSLEMLQQGADISLCLQVELIPKESMGLIADNEARYAQKEDAAEKKLQRQLKSYPPVPPPKGHWKGGQKDGQQKGGKKGGDKPWYPPKGTKKGGETKVTEPDK